MGRKRIARGKAQGALALAGLNRMGQEQGLQGRAGRGGVGHAIAAHDAVGRRRIGIGQTRSLANLAQNRRERLPGGAPVQPMPAVIIHRIAPKGGVGRKDRIGPHVPGPDMAAREIDHRASIDRRSGVLGGVGPVPVHGLQVSQLHQVIALAVGIARQAGFRGFRVKEAVGLVGTLVDGGAAVFDKADRLGIGLPVGRCRLPHAADPVVVGVRPPADQILVAIDPRLAIGAILDRQAALGLDAVGVVVIPIEPLAARDVRRQIVGVAAAAPRGVQMLRAIAPVGQRHVIVDAHEVDIRIGPEGIEVKAVVAARLVAEILGPVGGIADLDGESEDRAHLGRQSLERGDGRIAAARAADLGQPAQLGPDAEGIDAARNRAKFGVMQDEAAIAPLSRAGIGHRLTVLAELGRRRRTEKRRNLGRSRRRPVGRTRLPRRLRGGDAPAPGQNRLVCGL